MVILINHFTVKGDPDEFERVFAASSEFMVGQDGFISHELVKSLRDPHSYVNVAYWESVQAHQEVVRADGFSDHIRALAAVAEVKPDLYTPVLQRDSQHA
jgi:long-chain acyl-CoA synthetase